MNKKIAVFTTSDIFRTWEDERNGPQRAEFDGHPIFTTGNLERALAEGYDVWVVTTRTREDLSHHDAWWMKLVKSDQILTSMGRGGEGCNHPAILAPWQELFQRMSLPWEEGWNRNWQIARAALPTLGIALGRDFCREEERWAFRQNATGAIPGIRLSPAKEGEI